MKIVELKRGGSVVLPHGVILTVTKLKPGSVSLGIAAPPGIAITRPDGKAGPKAGERKPSREFGHGLV